MLLVSIFGCKDAPKETANEADIMLQKQSIALANDMIAYAYEEIIEQNRGVPHLFIDDNDFLCIFSEPEYKFTYQDQFLVLQRFFHGIKVKFTPESKPLFTQSLESEDGILRKKMTLKIKMKFVAYEEYPGKRFGKYLPEFENLSERQQESEKNTFISALLSDKFDMESFLQTTKIRQETYLKSGVVIWNASTKKWMFQDNAVRYKNIEKISFSEFSEESFKNELTSKNMIDYQGVIYSQKDADIQLKRTIGYILSNEKWILKDAVDIKKNIQSSELKILQNEVDKIYTLLSKDTLEDTRLYLLTCLKDLIQKNCEKKFILLQYIAEKINQHQIPEKTKQQITEEIKAELQNFIKPFQTELNLLNLLQKHPNISKNIENYFSSEYETKIASGTYETQKHLLCFILMLPIDSNRADEFVSKYPEITSKGFLEDLHCSACKGKKFIPCRRCDGSGVCNVCNGHGTRQIPDFHGYATVNCSKICLECKGSERLVCKSCNGRGIDYKMAARARNLLFGNLRRELYKHKEIIYSQIKSFESLI